MEIVKSMENILRVLPRVAENELLSPQQDFEIDEVIAKIQSCGVLERVAPGSTD